MIRRLLVACVLACGIAAPVQAALAVDATSNATASTNTTALTWNHTCATGAALFVSSGMIDNSGQKGGLVSSVTYNGVTLRQIGVTRDHGGSEMFDFWHVALTGCDGASHAISVNLAQNINVGGGVISGSAISFTGQHATYPYAAIGAEGCMSGPSNSLQHFTCSSAGEVSGGYVIGSTLAHTNTANPDGTQTAIVTQNGFGIGNGQSYASSYRAVSSGDTLGWTQTSSDVWSVEMVAVIPSGTDPTTPVVDNGGMWSFGSAVSSDTISNFVVSSGSNQLLLCGFAYYTSTTSTNVSSVAYGGNALTKLDENRQVLGAGRMVVEFWYRKLGTTAGSTANIAATLSASIAEFTWGCQSYFLVDQSSTFGTVAKNTGSGNPSVTVSSSTTALVQDITRSDGGLEVVPTGAVRWSDRSSSSETRGSAQTKAGAASVTMDWTGDASSNVTMGVGINYGAAGGAVTPRMTLLHVGAAS